MQGYIDDLGGDGLFLVRVDLGHNAVGKRIRHQTRVRGVRADQREHGGANRRSPIEGGRS